MGIIYALDPGYTESALVVLEGSYVLEAVTLANDQMLVRLLNGVAPDKALVIEQIESMGKAVGKEVFETVFWSGRFAQAWHPHPVARIPRAIVKLHLCGARNVKDTHVRQAIIDRYGPGKAVAIGRKASPGPLYDVIGHEFAALAVGLTYHDSRALVVQGQR